MTYYLNVCDDVLHKIFEKLSLKDVYNVTEAISLDVNSYLKSKLLRRLKSILNTNELSAIRNFLRSTKGIISGSFIPNVINDIENTRSDVDIYVSYNSDLECYLEMFKKELDPVEYEVTTDLKEYGDDYDENFMISLNNDRVKEYKKREC